uniref:ATP synthase mitochondrial F1 complex assembly factor 2 n=1 Tax=Meloidogyne hapla TaxID=6305 RepID=A0A1I8BZN0_MELHA
MPNFHQHLDIIMNYDFLNIFNQANDVEKISNALKEKFNFIWNPDESLILFTKIVYKIKENSKDFNLDEEDFSMIIEAFLYLCKECRLFYQENSTKVRDNLMKKTRKIVFDTIIEFNEEKISKNVLVAIEESFEKTFPQKKEEDARSISRRCLSNSVPCSSTNLNPKLIYKEAFVDKYDGNFVIKLDNNYLKSPAGNILLIKSEPLALLISNEWNLKNRDGLGNKSSMHFTALDNPHGETCDSVIEKLIGYLNTDTLLYFSDSQTSLFDVQQKQWLPIIKWINLKLKINLQQATEFFEPPKISKNCKQNLKQFLSFYNFPSLCAINYGAESLKSLILTIAAIDNYLSIEEAVNAANLEQIWQSKIWGSFEWHHNVEQLELRSRISAAILFVYLNSK